jgi:hypothetical protein
VNARRDKEAQQQATYRNWRVCQKRNEAAPESNGRHIGIGELAENLEATKYGKFCLKNHSVIVGLYG